MGTYLKYIEGLKQILPNEKLNLLNITIRNVYPDTDSFLRYAEEEMFAFVMLFNQKIDPGHEMEMKALSNSLARLTHSLDGTYIFHIGYTWIRSFLRKCIHRVMSSLG